jgi:hypothetical protein
VPAGDVEALVDAMRECLAATDDRLKQMGATGRNRVAMFHNIDKQASELATLFSDAMQANREGSRGPIYKPRRRRSL